MRIKSVRTHVLQVELPAGEVFAYSQGWYRQRRSLVVEIETADGTIGFGEAFGPATTNAAIVNEVYAPILIGGDALARETLWLQLYNAMRDHGRKGSALEALSAVDIALWDIAGKHFGVPCHVLAGRRYRTEVTAYATGFYRKQGQTTGAEARAGLVAEARRYADAGFTAMKVKIGFGPQDDVALVREVRAAVGPDIGLMIDANHAYDAATAVWVAGQLVDADIGWFEEPLVPEDLEGYAALRQRSPIALAAGEAEFGRWGFRDLLRHQAVDIVQPDCCAVGGLTEALKVADLADAWHVRCVPHVWGTAIAVAAALQMLAMVAPCPPSLHAAHPPLELDRTYNPLREELNATPPELGDGVVLRVPTLPGIGFEPARAVLERYAAH